MTRNQAKTVTATNLSCVLLLMCASSSLLLRQVKTHSAVEQFQVDESSVREIPDYEKKELRKSDPSDDNGRSLENKNGNENDGDNDREEDDDDHQVRFVAVISQGQDHQTPCRRQHSHVKFDTITPISRHFSLPNSTFTTPFSGLYIFSLQLQVQKLCRNLNNVDILTDKGHTLCSITSQDGGTLPQNGASAESSATNTYENVDHRDDLSSVKWDFSAKRDKVDSRWFQTPKSEWKRNSKTNDVEGFCEGVKFLPEGQKVFVRLGNTEGVDHESHVDDATADHGANKDIQSCYFVGGSFSGSLLSKDLEN